MGQAGKTFTVVVSVVTKWVKCKLKVGGTGCSHLGGAWLHLTMANLKWGRVPWGRAPVLSKERAQFLLFHLLFVPTFSLCSVVK